MFSITGNSSELSCRLFPTFDLTTAKKWELGFLDLLTYNSIPNVEDGINNKMCIEGEEPILLPTGSYEISNINEFIRKTLERRKSNVVFELLPNNNTLKSELFCSKRIDFTQPNTLASLLGFKGELLEPNKWHSSDKQVAINKVDVIRITCNAVKGSYKDGVEGHILHEFYPTVEPGFKIVEVPNSIKYLPVNKKISLEELHIRLEDQNGDLVNFRGERINIRLAIREKSN